MSELDDDTDEIRMIRAASSLSTIIHTTKDREMMRRLVPIREYLRRNPQFPTPHVATVKEGGVK